MYFACRVRLVQSCTARDFFFAAVWKSYAALPTTTKCNAAAVLPTHCRSSVLIRTPFPRFLPENTAIDFRAHGTYLRVLIPRAAGERRAVFPTIPAREKGIYL